MRNDLLPGVQQFRDGRMFMQVLGSSEIVSYDPVERIMYHGHSESFSIEKLQDHFTTEGKLERHVYIHERATRVDERRASMLGTIAWLHKRDCEKTARLLESNL